MLQSSNSDMYKVYNCTFVEHSGCCHKFQDVVTLCSALTGLHTKSSCGVMTTCCHCVQPPDKLLFCSVLALHNLIDNQEQRVWQEKLGQKRPELKNGKASGNLLRRTALMLFPVL